MAEQPSRKRRRSRGPDWQKFYCNGLPDEIIVIDDDSPEPAANTVRRATNGTGTGSGNPNPNNTAATTTAVASSNRPSATTTHPVTVDGSATRVPAKKRRREDDISSVHSTTYPVQYVGSHTNTPLQNTTPGGSTISSSGRTNSGINTTAPTSLSSNSQNGESQLPLKRKRTRQQAAIEAKRRDIDGFQNRLLTYKPPPYPPKKASDVAVRVIQDPPGPKNMKVDDDDGHYIVVPDAELTDKYQIVRLLGQGTFGKVVQANDRRRNKQVAVKIIRSVQKYRDASRIELRVLATLKANDEENRNRCIHLRDCFDYRGHICIVMDLLGQSVFDFLKGNGFVPFPNSQIQSFARQLFTSVAFLHDLNLIHTDLKPENILLCDNSYQTFTYNRRIPSSSSTINRNATQRRVLLDTEIRLIDFGSATFEDEYHSSVVSTRHYRAPEIILGLGWSFPCDIWSIGCILVEFFTGDALFQTHDNLEHLAMMEAVVGRRIDSYLVQNVNKISSRSSNSSNPAKYFKRLKLDYPNQDTTRGSRRFVKAMKHLDDVIPGNNKFLQNFGDLLRKIFVYDPAQRITAKEALNHDWFKEMAYTDDGTEAAKIRMERMMKGSLPPTHHA
jgi:dual-specificity kinase